MPASCCRIDPFSGSPFNCSLENPVDVSKIYTQDCFTVGLAFVKDHAVYLGGVAIGISCFMVRDGKLRNKETMFNHRQFFYSFQVLGMIFAVLLFKLIE